MITNLTYTLGALLIGVLGLPLSPIVESENEALVVNSLTCPDNQTVVITEDACTFDLQITTPALPDGFYFGQYSVTFEYLGISPGVPNSDFSPPPMTTLSVSNELVDTTVTFYGGENVITFLSVDSELMESSCSFTVTVLDGFAPYWPSTEFTDTLACMGQDPASAAIDYFLNQDPSITSPLDNCCEAAALEPININVDTICGNETVVTFGYIAADGSGDELGDPTDAPCIPAGSSGIQVGLLSDTLYVTIHFIDTLAPELIGAPANDTIGCDQSPTIPDLSAVDACEGDISPDSIKFTMVSSEPMDCGFGKINSADTYKWTVDDGCGNRDSSIWTVYFRNTTFDISVTGGGLECMSMSRTLTVEGDGTTYMWSTMETTPSIDVVASGKYFVTVTDVNGCCDVDSAQVSFGSMPTFEAVGGVITCVDPTVQLDAGIEADAYAWTGPDGFSSDMRSPVVSEPGDYTIEVTTGGCDASDVAVVSIDTIPPDVSASFGAVDCSKEIIGITSTSMTPDVVYSWLGPNGFTASVPDTAAGLAGTYTIIVSAPNGCSSFMDLVLDESISAPEVSVETQAATNGLDGVAIAVVAGGKEPYEYSWSTDETTDTIRDIAVDDYSITVTDANNCTATAQFSLTPVVTVCDLSATLISTNVNVTSTFANLKPVTSSILESECVQNVYGSLDTLLGRTYKYLQAFDQVGIAIDVSSDDNATAFIFTCMTFDKHTEQVCIGTASPGNNFSMPDGEGQYFIVMTGQGKGSYAFVVRENIAESPCDLAQSTLICGDSITDQLIGGSLLSTDNGSYLACFEPGNNLFSGPEKVYGLDISGPASTILDISSDKDVGVFLFSYQCASQCISSFQVSANERVTDTIMLNPGLYFLIIDQTFDEPAGANITVLVDCIEDLESLWPPRRSPNDTIECPVAQRVHRLNFSRGAVAPEGRDGTDKMWIVLLSPDRRRQIGERTDVVPGERFSVVALGDTLENDDKSCGYLERENEQITFAVVTEQNEFFIGRPEYGSGDGFFRKDSSSSVEKLRGINPVLANLNPVEIKDVRGDTNVTSFTVQSGEGNQWEILPWTAPWIDSITVLPNSMVGNGSQDVKIWHQENDTVADRSAEIMIKFTDSIPLQAFTFTQTKRVVSSIEYITNIPGVKIFPNPTSGMVNIEIPAHLRTGSVIKVRDISGRLIDTVQPQEGISGVVSVNLADKMSGIYLLEIILGNTAVVQKVVKQ